MRAFVVLGSAGVEAVSTEGSAKVSFRAEPVRPERRPQVGRRAHQAWLHWSPMHHKRCRPKARRAGCLLCKPSKLNAHKTADRMKARAGWKRDWDVR